MARPRGIEHLGLRALAILAVGAGGGGAGFVVLFVTGYVGGAVILAYPLMVSPDPSEAPGA